MCFKTHAYHITTEDSVEPKTSEVILAYLRFRLEKKNILKCKKMYNSYIPMYELFLFSHISIISQYIE